MNKFSPEVKRDIGRVILALEDEAMEMSTDLDVPMGDRMMAAFFCRLCDRTLMRLGQRDRTV